MENKKYKVYCYINKINNKRYIGITCKTLKERYNRGRGYQNSLRFQNAINKYGFENFFPIILFENLSREEACKKEIESIARYNTTNPEYGYNISKGGETPTLTKEVAKKISKSLTGKKLSEEHRKSISLAKLGKPSPRKGTHLSQETKNKISKFNKGKKLSAEHVQKIKDALHKRYLTKKINRIWTLEQRQKLSEMKKGQPSPWKGKHFSEEQRKKMSLAHNPIIVYCEELNKYGTISEFIKMLNIPKSNIYRIIKGKKVRNQKYHFIIKEKKNAD